MDCGDGEKACVGEANITVNWRSMMKTYGYVWISSQEWDDSSRIADMLNSGIPNEMIVVEKPSGKDAARPLYDDLVGRLEPGDVLVVKSINELGRSPVETLEQWRTITQKKQVDVVVLDIPMLNTHIKANHLTGTFIADLMLQILSYAAQRERKNKKQRQAQGIVTAKEDGVKFGRPKVYIPPEYESIKELYIKKELSSRSAAKKLGVSQNTFLQWFSGGKGK